MLEELENDVKEPAHQAILEADVRGPGMPYEVDSFFDITSIFPCALSRRVNNDHTIDFEGQNYEISDTKRKSVTIVHHPMSKFWVVERPPKDVWPTVLGAYSL